MKKKLLRLVKNKYTLSTVVFLLWLTFFNEIDLIYIFQSRREVTALRNEVQRMKDDNARATQSLFDLTTNAASLEKFARENYYMKRENEVVYVFKERPAQVQ
ncbi:MAG: FtsB family cell division protein [Flavobacteriales bacterium]|jgi:cell division protein FtsB